MGKRRIVWIGIGVLTLLALTPAVALASDGGPLEETAAGDVLWTTLAPIVAIATATERILEMFWDRWERAGVWPNKKGVSDTGASDYILRKKSGSHWLGTLVAIIAVGLTNVRFFRLLGFDVLFSDLTLFQDPGIGGIFEGFTVGTVVDWIMTAGIVGWGGTELTHSVIEGLVKGRNLWKEMRQVESGRKSILDAKFFNDYVAPQLERKGISVAGLREAFQTLNAVGVSVDKFIGSMTAGNVDRMLDRLEAKPSTARAGHAVRSVLEGVPPTRRAEIPNVLNLLTPEQRRRFLGG